MEMVQSIKKKRILDILNSLGHNSITKEKQLLLCGSFFFALEKLEQKFGQKTQTKLFIHITKSEAVKSKVIE